MYSTEFFKFSVADVRVKKCRKGDSNELFYDVSFENHRL